MKLKLGPTYHIKSILNKVTFVLVITDTKRVTEYNQQSPQTPLLNDHCPYSSSGWEPGITTVTTDRKRGPFVYVYDRDYNLSGLSEYKPAGVLNEFTILTVVTRTIHLSKNPKTLYPYHVRYRHVTVLLG